LELREYVEKLENRLVKVYGEKTEVLKGLRGANSGGLTEREGG
jgi:hypothetical protein